MKLDSGNYTCVVSNRHGKLRHTVVLDVFGTYSIVLNYTRKYYQVAPLETSSTTLMPNKTNVDRKLAR